MRGERRGKELAFFDVFLRFCHHPREGFRTYDFFGYGEGVEDGYAGREKRGERACGACGIGLAHEFADDRQVERHREYNRTPASRMYESDTANHERDEAEEDQRYMGNHKNRDG